MNLVLKTMVRPLAITSLAMGLLVAQGSVITILALITMQLILVLELSLLLLVLLSLLLVGYVIHISSSWIGWLIDPYELVVTSYSELNSLTELLEQYNLWMADRSLWQEQFLPGIVWGCLLLLCIRLYDYIAFAHQSATTKSRSLGLVKRLVKKKEALVRSDRADTKDGTYLGIDHYGEVVDRNGM